MQKDQVNHYKCFLDEKESCFLHFFSAQRSRMEKRFLNGILSYLPTNIKKNFYIHFLSIPLML